MNVFIPPIKSQGIKTKLVPWINDLIRLSDLDLKRTNWIEPFFGTGVVGLNTIVGGKRIVGDTNPHIINFYNSLLEGRVTARKMREYLLIEGGILRKSSENGYEHYKRVRDRFNQAFDPFDFIFLSRTAFNGMMRFNRKGLWNIPFCKKADRFAPAYITKICNQIEATQAIIRQYNWEFHNASFLETIERAQEGDLIYCDPPYYGRYVDYYNGWSEDDEQNLFLALKKTKAHFILSTWHHNEFRENTMVSKFWNEFNVQTKEHFYHAGGNIENRHAVVEALFFNFEVEKQLVVLEETAEQLELEFV